VSAGRLLLAATRTRVQDWGAEIAPINAQGRVANRGSASRTSPDDQRRLPSCNEADNDLDQQPTEEAQDCASRDEGNDHCRTSLAAARYGGKATASCT
jgi:hypothetical protein